MSESDNRNIIWGIKSTRLSQYEPISQWKQPSDHIFVLQERSQSQPALEIEIAHWSRCRQTGQLSKGQISRIESKINAVQI